MNLQVKRVITGRLLSACRRFLAQDPVANVLPLGDLYPPLFQMSDVYCAVEKRQVVGVCSIYRAYPIPNLVLGADTQEIKQALTEKALKEVSDEFVSLCNPRDASMFEKYSIVLHHHAEQQMIADPPNEVEYGNVRVERVGKDELESLNTFYGKQSAEAWVPIQFEMGPYYCVKAHGKIVAAAGVHSVTPQIAQLGNIFTDEAYRNRGFSTACTSTLAADLASEGRIISLFVRKDNDPAIHVYEKLGFHKANDIAFLVMRKENVGQQTTCSEVKM